MGIGGMVRMCGICIQGIAQKPILFLRLMAPVKAEYRPFVVMTPHVFMKIRRQELW